MLELPIHLATPDKGLLQSTTVASAVWDFWNIDDVHLYDTGLLKVESSLGSAKIFLHF